MGLQVERIVVIARDNPVAFRRTQLGQDVPI